MTPTDVSSTTQAFQTLSVFRTASSALDEQSALSASAILAKDRNVGSVDKVNISDHSLQAVTGIKKEEKIAEPNILSNDSASYSSAAKVEFVYDQKGDLSIRYMDRMNRLVYQVPSELMQRLKEAASKSDSPLYTKA